MTGAKPTFAEVAKAREIAVNEAQAHFIAHALADARHAAIREAAALFEPNTAGAHEYILALLGDEKP